ncbi:restriction endonuclease subunit S [Neptuniibacter pectenicola]|uniref:Restriction endonuclease subunit S n=1 Tax=Neptuniibacter pectenicola TaxID=1806669 RepID=A0ABU9TSS2_9GAMM
MGSNWKEVELESITHEVTVGFVGSMTHEYVDDGVPFLRSKNITEFRVNWDDIRYISDEFHKRISKSKLQPGDVAIVRTGKPGVACVIPDTWPEANCSDVVIVRVDKAVLNEHFFCYFMNSNASHHVNAHLVGAVQQHFNVGAAKALKVPLPSINEQSKIVNVLKTLDDKIELNRQINETLEQMAQALFKSWFVDFDPVIDNALDAGNPIPEALEACAEQRKQLKASASNGKAEIPILPDDIRALFPSEFEFTEELGYYPKDWVSRQIKEIANVIKGKSYKSSELLESKTALVTLKSFKRGGGYRLDGLKEYTGKYKPEQEVFAGDLVIAYTDVTQAADVIGKPALVISDPSYQHLVISLDVAVVRPSEDSYKYYLSGLAQTDDFQYHTLSHTTGTTVLHLSKNAVPEYRFALPSRELVTVYVNKVKPIFDSIDLSIGENRTLLKMRNTLLPKLISGELQIPDAEKLVAETLN